MPRIVNLLLLSTLCGAVIGLGVLVARDRTQATANGYASAVEAAASSVVNISSTKLVRARRHPICELPRYRELCDALESANPRLQNSLGSGVIVSEDGYILTNAHVIANADEIAVALADGRITSATIVGTDPETDLAVIHADATGLIPIQIGTSDAAQVGDIVLAIGNPFGIGQSVSMGIISAKGRAGFSSGPYDDFLQTDAPINPGNSGGALIDVQGRLVGINSLIFSQTGGYQGISFATPVKLALQVFTEIIREGRVIRGWLGIEVAKVAGANAIPGLVVATVVKDSPAAAAGLLPGDRILRINEQLALSAHAVTQQIAFTTPGSDVVMQVIRNDTPVEIHATAGTRPIPAR